MPPRDPTNAQISSRLSYSQDTPAFLRKLQNRVAGVRDSPEYEDEYSGGGEFYDDGSGRPPIPQRPAIPERPEDEPGSADEDDGDEKPQVVVLREGKHLSAHQAENERRKEKGLSPLPDPQASKPSDDTESSKTPVASKAKAPAPSLSFSSSSGNSTSKTKSNKRKAGVLGDAVDELVKGGAKSKDSSAKKKPKKAEKKTLLSFSDDA